MKLLFTSLFAVLVSTYSGAQIGRDFALPTPAEISMKDCAFDPEAPAVILLDKGFANYDDQYALLSDRHIRMKILKQDGMKHADVSVIFYSHNQFEFLHSIEAVTINVDEKGNREDFRVDKKSIYFRKINEYYSEMTFAFPQARVGSILEYKYSSTMKSYAGLRDWSFQSTLPVCLSGYYFRPAPNLEFTYRVQKKESYPIVVTKPDHDGFVYFEMKNIPGLTDEPYMDAREDYVQKIRFQITKYAGSFGNQNYMSSWNEVARELTANSEFGSELKVNIPDEQKTLLLSLSNKPSLERMRVIHDYIRRNFQWNRFIGIYAGSGLKNLYNKKTGSSTDINLALVNLLKEGGLEAYPMIVSERSNGRINVKTPFLKQFNNTYAAVIIDGKNYYLDATDMVTPCHLIPHSILNTTALIIRRNTGVLTEIREEKLKYSDNIFVYGVLSDDGTLSGKVRLVSQHYARAERLSRLTDKNQDVLDRMKKGKLNLELDSLEFINKETDTMDLEEKFNFKTALQTTDEYSFLPLSMFTGFEENPFILKERFSNINFGYKKVIYLNNTISLPPSYTVDALPKSIRLVNSDRTVDFIREVFYSAETSQLMARIKIDFTKSEYTADEYPDLKEFFKKMNDLLNEQVVLKKKSL